MLVERLRTAADRDFLTDLLNTRAFDGLLEDKLEQNRPFGLVLGDMDGLKTVNEEEGHAVGNEVLRRAAEVLQSVVRSDDQLARTGGDEFAVLTTLPGSDAVRALCGRLTTALALFRAANERLNAQKLIRSRLTGGEIVPLPAEQEPFPLRSVR